LVLLTQHQRVLGKTNVITSRICYDMDEAKVIKKWLDK
jgi:hypothetical protein